MEEEVKETNKKNKLLWYLIPGLVAVILVIAGLLFVLNNKKEDTKETKPRLEDDYYESINYGNVNDVWTKAQTQVSTQLIALVASIENDTAYTNDNYHNYIELYDDTEGKNKQV